MNFINNIDFIFAFCRRISHFLTDFADIIHTVIRSGVYLNHIHGIACGNGFAGSALAAGTSPGGILAIDCLSKNFGYGSLAGSPGSAEQIGMSDPACLNLVL